MPNAWLERAADKAEKSESVQQLLTLRAQLLEIRDQHRTPSTTSVSQIPEADEHEPPPTAP